MVPQNCPYAALKGGLSTRPYRFHSDTVLHGRTTPKWFYIQYRMIYHKPLKKTSDSLIHLNQLRWLWGHHETPWDLKHSNTVGKKQWKFNDCSNKNFKITLELIKNNTSTFKWLNEKIIHQPENRCYHAAIWGWFLLRHDNIIPVT
jgi:hypothetical protein